MHGFKWPINCTCTRTDDEDYDDGAGVKYFYGDGDTENTADLSEAAPSLPGELMWALAAVTVVGGLGIWSGAHTRLCAMQRAHAASYEKSPANGQRWQEQLLCNPAVCLTYLSVRVQSLARERPF